MESNVNFLQTFNPGESRPELLEYTLVGRKYIVDTLEQLVIEGTNSDNKFQRIIIGPRGSGKTHTLKVLHNRILSKTELKDHLEIAYLCEDEYGVATFLDFLIRIFRAFIRWAPENMDYLSNEIENLKKVPIADQERIAIRVLLNFIKNKTLLIIVENIGNIFDKNKGFGKTGQQKFRDLVQQHPIFIIMASNQSLFSDIQNEDMPFFGFFSFINLDKLSFEDSINFLKSIAEWEKNTKLHDFLNTPKGKGRIKAIYDLIGGNHRLLVTFYSFLKTEYINKLSESFIKTINDLIPYYQNLMFILPPQQQKIIQYLCQNRLPANVKSIAENCFIPQNIISKQLNNLEKLKYVEKTKSGKETYYELNEPLLRICFEVKENREGPIKLFTDFLGNLYSAEEIRNKYMYYHILYDSTKGTNKKEYYFEQFYYKEALKRFHSDTLCFNTCEDFDSLDLEKQQIAYIEDLEKRKEYTQILEFTSKFQEKNRNLLLKQAKAFGKTGEIEKEEESIKHILAFNDNDIEALLMLAYDLKKKKLFNKSIEYFNKILKTDENNMLALDGIIDIYFSKNDFQEAEKYLNIMNRISPLNPMVLINMGIALLNQNKLENAYTVYSKLNELQPNDSEILLTLGEIDFEQKKYDVAKTNIQKVINLNSNNLPAHRLLGILHRETGDLEVASRYFSKIIEIDPKNSEGWRLLGTIDHFQSKMEAANHKFLKAIDLDKNNCKAYESYGTFLMEQKKYKEAEIHIRKLTELNKECPTAWELMGEVEKLCLNFKKAIECYKKSLRIEGKNARVLNDIAGLLMKIGKIEEANNYIDKAISIEPNNSKLIRNKINLLMIDDDFNNAITLLKRAIDIEPDFPCNYFDISACYLGNQNIEEALVNLRKALEIIKKDNDAEDILPHLESILSVILIKVDRGNFTQFLEKIEEIIDRYGFINQFYDIFSIAIFDFLDYHESIEKDRYEIIENYLSDKFKNNKNMTVPLKYLIVGKKYFAEKNKKALLILTKEERTVFIKYINKRKNTKFNQDIA
jgi:tetratricopeptide (TPR) repeat protein